MELVFENFSLISCYKNSGGLYFTYWLIMGLHSEDGIPISINIQTNQLSIAANEASLIEKDGDFTLILKNSEYLAVSSWKISVNTHEKKIILKLLTKTDFYKDLSRQNFVYDFWSRKSGYIRNLELKEATRLLNMSYYLYRLAQNKLESKAIAAQKFRQKHPWLCKINFVKILLELLD